MLVTQWRFQRSKCPSLALTGLLGFWALHKPGGQKLQIEDNDYKNLGNFLILEDFAMFVWGSLPYLLVSFLLLKPHERIRACELIFRAARRCEVREPILTLHLVLDGRIPEIQSSWLEGAWMKKEVRLSPYGWSEERKRDVGVAAWSPGPSLRRPMWCLHSTPWGGDVTFIMVAVWGDFGESPCIAYFPIISFANDRMDAGETYMMR